jgi:nucleolar protein 53
LLLYSRLKFLNQEIEARDKKLAKLREKREKIRAIKVKEPKQLSKRKFEPLDLEFNLGEEINGNLRGIKPEGNILEDRYKSFQRRNIIEPTVRQRYVSYGCISVVLLFNEIW